MKQLIILFCFHFFIQLIPFSYGQTSTNIDTVNIYETKAGVRYVTYKNILLGKGLGVFVLGLHQKLINKIV